MIHNVLEDKDLYKSVISAIKNNQANEKLNDLTKECNDIPGMIDNNLVNETEKVDMKDGHLCINENNDVLKGNVLINVKDKSIVPINNIV